MNGITIHENNDPSKEKTVSPRDIAESIRSDDTLFDLAEVMPNEAVLNCLYKEGTFNPKEVDFESFADETLKWLRGEAFRQ